MKSSSLMTLLQPSRCPSQVCDVWASTHFSHQAGILVMLVQPIKRPYFPQSLTCTSILRSGHLMFLFPRPTTLLTSSYLHHLWNSNKNNNKHLQNVISSQHSLHSVTFLWCPISYVTLRASAGLQSSLLPKAHVYAVNSVGSYQFISVSITYPVTSATLENT